MNGSCTDSASRSQYDDAKKQLHEVCTYVQTLRAEIGQDELNR